MEGVGVVPREQLGRIGKRDPGLQLRRVGLRDHSVRRDHEHGAGNDGRCRVRDGHRGTGSGAHLRVDILDRECEVRGGRKDPGCRVDGPEAENRRLTGRRAGRVCRHGGACASEYRHRDGHQDRGKRTDDGSIHGLVQRLHSGVSPKFEPAFGYVRGLSVPVGPDPFGGDQVCDARFIRAPLRPLVLTERQTGNFGSGQVSIDGAWPG